MRDDMSKVIVERPRPGSDRRVARRSRRLDAKRIVLDEEERDDFPARIGHKRAVALGQDWKSLNENLAPLRRYLIKQVGRPWSKVWSEICRGISLDNTVQKHVRDHTKDFVAETTSLRNGEIYFAGRWGGLQLLSKSRWPELYVDPRTGILRRNVLGRYAHARQRASEVAEAQKLAARLRILDGKRQLHLLDDGNWWEVTLAPIPQETVPGWRGRPVLANKPVTDLVERAGLSSLPREVRYQRRGVYAIAKRPLSRKEIRALGLRG